MVTEGNILDAVRVLSVHKYRTPGLRGDKVAFRSLVSTGGGFLAPVTIARHSTR